ncbi:MAG TPA: HAD family hydrolase [Ignavibacteria bacterium]|nr:HAD family hydrolase [Ignavibacteria bacterium]
MSQKIKAVVFDVDGTLYNETKLRRYVLWMIFVNFLKSPIRTYKYLKIVLSYRKFHEHLRFDAKTKNKFKAQVQITADKFGMNYDDVYKIINEWIHIKPLPFISKSKYKDLDSVIAWLKKNNFRIGLLSDYPCMRKAEALGIKDDMDLIKCSTDEDIDFLKPSSLGFTRVAQILNLQPQEIAYVGDRSHIDMVGAIDANFVPVLLHKKESSDKFYTINTLSELIPLIEKLNS